MSITFNPNDNYNKCISDFEFINDKNDKSVKLGVGSFACVKLAREKKSGKLMALKIVLHYNYHLSSITNFIYLIYLTNSSN